MAGRLADLYVAEGPIITVVGERCKSNCVSFDPFQANLAAMGEDRSPHLPPLSGLAARTPSSSISPLLSLLTEIQRVLMTITFGASEDMNW